MNTSGPSASPLLKSASLVAVIFGALSVFSGGNVLFGGDQAQRAAGAYAGFVVWFNFLGGFAYVAAGAGLWMRQRWAVPLAFLITAATLLVFAAFGLHVASGAAYEIRTVAAMTLRLAIWLAISWVAWRRIGYSP